MKSMKTWAGLATVVLIVLYVVMTYNTAIRFENELETSYKNNQNVLSNSFYGPLEAAKLGEAKYKEMITEMIKQTANGYQGATGGKAMMLWLGQTYPNISAELQLKFVSIGEAGLAKFQSSQTDLLSRGQSYQNFLETMPTSIVAGAFGFPKKINLKEILTPVTDDSTQESFKTKKRAPIQ
jgi:hypothetical protein